MTSARQTLSGLPNPIRKPKTITEYEYQEFCSGPDTFEVQVIPGNEATQGKPFVLWDDVQDVIPNAYRLQYRQRAINFMADVHGNRLLPLRIEYLPDAMIQVIMSRGSSLPAPTSPPPPPPRPLPSSDHGSIFEGLGRTSPTGQGLYRRDSLMSIASLSDDAKKKFGSTVYLYESYLKSVHDGQSTQANLIRRDFREQFWQIESEMSKNQERQHEMHGVHQQTLDHVTFVQSSVQAILTQTFEWYDYPVPRLFVVLPKNNTTWDPINPSQNLRLHFLCECEEHARSSWGVSSNMPHHIHLVNHEGYDLESPAEFFRRYGSYVLNLLQMLKYGVSVGGFVVPALSLGQENNNLFTRPEHSNMELRVNQAIEYLQYLSSVGQLAPPTMVPGMQRNLDELGALEGADLRRLGAFLKSNDDHKVFGDLYRIVTNEGHVRWVCVDHYRESYNAVVMKDLSEVVAINHGSFKESLGRVELSLSSATLASQFYKVMERATFVLELKVTLKWDVSMNDLKVLRDSVQKSNIASLELTCGVSTSDILNRSKKSDPLWQIMMSSSMQSFILNDYTGFFSRVTIPAIKTNLRVLKISERVEWKKEGDKVVELLEKCPHLQELHLGCTEVDEAYRAIKRINYDFRTLEQLALDDGDSNEMQVQFESGVPASMDLVVSDLSNTLLKDMRVLRTLHLRLGIHVKVNIDSQWLTGIVSRNSNLTKMIIQCETSEFLRLHIAVKEALNEERSSNLHTLKLYGGRNQLSIANLQGNTAIELELLSTNASRDVVDTLLKVYETRLTKVRIEGDDILTPLCEAALNGSALILKQVEIKSSHIRADMLYSLRVVLGRCESTLTDLSIAMDVHWDGSEQSSELTDFVADFEHKWTKITISDGDAAAWIGALYQRRFIIPEGVLNRVSSAKPEMILAHNLRLVGKASWTD
ncbi:hypothetical protein BGZ58_004514 [Dissophora ornata]|nr:hypothetical protein BGZ58_004514 [Dissophora ornata]